ncbi:hypothetical protein UNH65_19625 [Chitinophaga sp. 180180018-2]|nr:hypothetical protein [Chitinophaga sp. 212800010-3]
MAARGQLLKEKREKKRAISPAGTGEFSKKTTDKCVGYYS